MSDDDPISEWLDRLPAGDSLAQHNVYRKFAKDIERVARRMLTGVPLGDSDSEDIAVKVLKSLFERVQDGRIEPPENRNDLWHLLLGMTRNKSAEVVRHKLAMKRGRGKVKGNSGFGSAKNDENLIDGVPDKRPGPEIAFDEAQRLVARLDSLQDDQLRQIALLRMAGHSNEEIANALNCGKRTIERRVAELRDQLDSADDDRATS